MPGCSRRQFLGSTAIALSATAGCSGFVSEGNSDGVTLETLEVRGSDGSELTVPATTGVTLLDFFATWCAPCKPQMAELRAVNEEFPDLRLVSITREQDADTVARFWQDYQGTWPVAQDPKLHAFEAFDVNRVPTMLVVDADGSTAWRHSGLASAGDIAKQVREAQP